MPHDWEDRLRDILRASTEIRRFVAGMDEQAFRNDPKTRMAVLAELSVIGDAAAHLPRHVQTRRPDVPWEEICRMRTLVDHAAEGLDGHKVWNVVATGLEPLEAVVREMVAEAER